MDNSNRFKVRLESYNHGMAEVPTSSVVFDVMPAIVESISVEYQSIDPVHLPGSFFAYKGTKARTFELTDLKLVSRTTAEATQNQAYVNILRGWTRSYFGMGVNDKVGAPTPTATSSKVPNTYKTQTTSSTNGADMKNLKPLSDDEIRSMLNYRTQKLSAITGINPNQVRHYKVGTSVSEGEKAYLHSQGVTNQVTTTLDKLTMLEAKQLRVFNSTDKNIPSGAIVRLPGALPTAVSSDAKRAASKQNNLKFLGAPPDVLYLTAYSDARDKGGELDRVTNIFRIPVVVTALTINYPNDVDYIPTIEGQPFPIIMGLSVSLTESHSPREFEKFDLFQYREGTLPGF